MSDARRPRYRGYNTDQTVRMARILVVEDDPDIAALLAHYLERVGHEVQQASTGGDGLAQAFARAPDVVVLDVLLPGLDGLDVCGALRRDIRTARVPIILLTALASEADRVTGLERGADDYVTKPFSPRELVARVDAHLRREQRAAGVTTPDDLRRVGRLTVDLARHVVHDGTREVALTAKEFLLLRYLIDHEGRVVSRDRLLSEVWDYPGTTDTRTVDVHVRRLRMKLPLLAGAIVTVKQFGYKLVAPAPPAP